MSITECNMGSNDEKQRFIGEYLRCMKSLSKKGGCLHYEAGDQCDSIISAHSIQKSRQLEHISEKGHIVQLSADYSILVKANGRIAAKEVGIRSASTFSGFCRKHDNELFRPIDDSYLEPNDEQIFLYAYRCLCREYFIKENAVALTGSDYGETDLNEEETTMIEALALGQRLGFHYLKQHKTFYDDSIADSRFSDIEYVCFCSHDEWAVQLSGVFCPDFSFTGDLLQDLSRLDEAYQMVAFFTAPMSLSDWGFVIAWHVSSGQVAESLVSSLASAHHRGMRMSDALLRLTFSCCENHAIKPSW